jgi:SAM-dependent methyltransferase
MGGRRLTQRRRLPLWRQDYLVYRYLWPNIEAAVKKAITDIGQDSPVVLDLGCGHKPYRDLFNGARYIGIDHGAEDSSPDVLGDARQIPIRSGAVDIVFSTQVVEHVPHPDRMVRECGRILRPGGYLIMTGPMYWPLHEEPFDFYRFTKYGFAQLLADSGFSEWEIKEDGGAWAQAMLTLCLLLSGKWLAPARCLVNIIGLVLDTIMKSGSSPSNYTILAKR